MTTQTSATQNRMRNSTFFDRRYTNPLLLWPLAFLAFYVFSDWCAVFAGGDGLFALILPLWEAHALFAFLAILILAWLLIVTLANRKFLTFFLLLAFCVVAAVRTDERTNRLSALSLDRSRLSIIATLSELERHDVSYEPEALRTQVNEILKTHPKIDLSLRTSSPIFHKYEYALSVNGVFLADIQHTDWKPGGEYWIYLRRKE